MTAVLTAEPQALTLTPDQVLRFHTDGFLGPFQAYTPEEMAELRPRIEQVLERDAPDHTQKHHNRHLDERLIWDLASNPAVVRRMTAVVGEDLLLWRTNFFIKQPGALAIPWHQDNNYWPLEPAVVMSAWMAIDDATLENSCPQVIPGSQSKLIPHIKMKGVAFGEGADPDRIDASKAVPLEMKAGEFFLFNERTLHYSAPNTSSKRRIGLAIRAILPFVRVTKWDAPRHAAVQLSGADRMGFNRHAEPPAP
ncbi:MAG: phytanoyl-CoA dioxygenase family protein [Planctomycetota bacterium]|nr:phytanoyl-CoA dioxygenase family protein [Planctomycetota bacterium]